MSNLFLRAKRTNFSGIESWDTSNVITMEGMFARCTRFNIPIGCWNVSKVKDMIFMFYECAAFNQPLDKSANLKNQCRIFHNCKDFAYSLNDKEKCEQITCHTIILSMKR